MIEVAFQGMNSAAQPIVAAARAVGFDFTTGAEIFALGWVVLTVLLPQLTPVELHHSSGICLVHVFVEFLDNIMTFLPMFIRVRVRNGVHPRVAASPLTKFVRLQYKFITIAGERKQVTLTGCDG